MKRLPQIIISCAALAVVLAASFLFWSNQAKAAPATGCGWTVVPSPNDGQIGSNLDATVALSAKNVWALGYTGDYFAPDAFIEHWDGTQWNLVSIPNLGPTYNELTGITALSAHNIWAVGFEQDFSNPTLIEHWDGTEWSIVPSPFVLPQDILYGVSAVSGNDIWAVGDSMNTNTQVINTLIEHWNGSSWSMVSSPNPSPETNQLNAVAVIAKNNVWAVGSYSNENGVQTLVEHWNGTVWSVVSSPSLTEYDRLNGITAISATDVWAVGATESQTLIEHWDGSQWNIVPSPNSSSGDFLQSVAAATSSDIWAVGGTYPDNQEDTQTLIEHWNGTKWTIATSPSPGLRNVLNGVTAVPNTRQVWTVGTFTTSSSTSTLTEFHC